MKNAINWFELPTADMDRAVKFWEAVLGKPLKREVFGGVPHAVFASEEKEGESAVTGALIPATEKHRAGANGALLYFDCTDGVPATLARAERAGATVLLPVTAIGPFGWIAQIRDLDGNSIGLHAAAK